MGSFVRVFGAIAARASIHIAAAVLAGVAGLVVVLSPVTSFGGASAESADPSPVRVAYGSDPFQFGELWLPTPERSPDSDTPVPVVVLIHGGFWRNPYGLELMTPLAEDLVARGVAVWNIEYRRVGDDGGGWPGTMADVADAIDARAEFDPDTGAADDATQNDITADVPFDAVLDVDDVTVVGHSAGGHLALWSASRQLLPADAPGHDPVVRPVRVIGQGPVADLAAAAADHIGSDAVFGFLGGSIDEYPDRYAVATPVVVDGVETVVVRGTNDVVVPATYTIPPGGGDVTVIDVEGADHFDLIDPAGEAWQAVLTAIGLADRG
ncbi:hypothetical protein BH24ACT5_BH24ACT5_30600 [soil metagenome]